MSTHYQQCLNTYLDYNTWSETFGSSARSCVCLTWLKIWHRWKTTETNKTRNVDGSKYITIIQTWKNHVHHSSTTDAHWQDLADLKLPVKLIIDVWTICPLPRLTYFAHWSWPISLQKPKCCSVFISLNRILQSNILIFLKYNICWSDYMWLT